MDKPTTLPKATHEGTITINDIQIESYNLDNGERVLSRIGVLKAIGRTGKAKGGRKYDEEFKTPVFLTAQNIKPFISNVIKENSEPIHFIGLNGSPSIGYKAQLLPSICYVFMDAMEAGVLKPNQLHIAEQCKLLVRGFATTGIIALVDEATGYQIDRGRTELQDFLDKFLLKAYARWTRRFPNEFFEGIFEMRGWTWKDTSTQMPGIVGTYINNFVYERLAPGVLAELQRKNPVSAAGRRKAKHHQYLTPDVGHPALHTHLMMVMAFQRAASGNWQRFMEMMDAALPRFGHTIPIQFNTATDSSLADTQPEVKAAPTVFNQQLKGLLSIPPPPKLVRKKAEPKQVKSAEKTNQRKPKSDTK